jgi:cytochrome P450
MDTKAHTLPPGPQGTFLRRILLGKLAGKEVNRLHLLTDLLEWGDIVYFKLTPKIGGYALQHPDYIKQVLVDEAEKFHKGPMLKRALGPQIGKGLLLSEGDFHRKQRKLVQPAFHHQRLISYGQAMTDYTADMLHTWHAGEVIEIHEAMMTLTMRIVGKTLFDADVLENAGAIGDAITTVLRAVNRQMSTAIRPPEWLPTPSKRRAAQATKVLDATFLKFIADRRASGEDKGDLLSMLLLSQDEDDGTGMDDSQVYAEIRTLFSAGHETTANALTWAWYLLAQHPEKFAQLAEELAQVLQGRTPSLHDLAKLPYTDMVIKEAMRLYPPAWVMNRQAVAATTIGGYTIPAGSLVFMSPYTMHHHPRYFEHPNDFVPERWTPEFEKQLPKFAYFPFGGGPRICIGNQFAMMEARLILATIAQHWQMELVPGQHVAMEPLITLRAKEGIQMRLRQTEPAHTDAVFA